MNDAFCTDYRHPIRRSWKFLLKNDRIGPPGEEYPRKGGTFAAAKRPYHKYLKIGHCTLEIEHYANQGLNCERPRRGQTLVENQSFHDPGEVEWKDKWCDIRPLRGQPLIRINHELRQYLTPPESESSKNLNHGVLIRHPRCRKPAMQKEGVLHFAERP